MENDRRFESALYGVGERIKRVLVRIPEPVKCETEEIRIRNGLPVTLTVRGDTLFVCESGQISQFITRDIMTAVKTDLDESFRLLCRNSVYAHTDEIKNGYIMMKSGHRAGICGTLTESGSMRDISSVNIRIAREIFGAADCIVKRYCGGGLLIAGPPGSGKTTVLRDLVRQLSDGANGKYRRLSVIDSRGEISGSSDGECINDLGRNTDVLMIKDKAAGIEMAVRTMFPDIIAFDEIGTAAELRRVSESFNAGVSVITTAHIGDERDLLCRSVTAGLIRNGAVSSVAVLGRDRSDGIRFINPKELSSDVAI